MAVVIPNRNELFTPDGLPTLRFYEFLRNLTDQGNTASDVLVGIANNAALALIFDLRQQVGSGDFLTSDETGFTVDLDTLSVDMDEA